MPTASLKELETDLREAEQTVLSRYAADSAPGGGELYSTMPALSDSGAPSNSHFSSCRAFSYCPLSLHLLLREPPCCCLPACQVVS